jgi:multisubunit Na+/H+ antiporter MnhB subunit
MLVFSVYLLLRGHNAPGGGFSAALVAGTAFSLMIMAEGPELVRRALRVEPLTITAWGVLAAAASGLPAVLAGEPYMTGLWWPLDPQKGGLALGTPLLFDVGVFLVVLGAVVTLVLHLEER